MSETDNCPVPPNLQTYSSAFLIPFESTPAINFSHKAAPRFGNTANITVLVEGTSDEKESYLKGLVSGAIVLFIFFLLWTCILVYFRLRGPNVYGWLSGSRIPLPPKPAGATEISSKNNIVDHNEPVEYENQEDEDDDIDNKEEEAENYYPDQEQPEQHQLESTNKGGMEEENWDMLYHNRQKQDKRLRLMVFVASLGTIVAGIMMAIKG